jgi:hypothetical protein
MLTELILEDSVQMSLFEVSDDQQNQLQTVVDSLNRKLGQNAVRYASMGMQQPWRCGSSENHHATPHSGMTCLWWEPSE